MPPSLVRTSISKTNHVYKTITVSYIVFLFSLTLTCSSLMFKLHWYDLLWISQQIKPMKFEHNSDESQLPQMDPRDAAHVERPPCGIQSWTLGRSSVDYRQRSNCRGEMFLSHSLGQNSGGSSLILYIPEFP